MICSYCGTEWKTLPGASGLNHDDNGCPMAGVYTYPPVIECVNKAIGTAKSDTENLFLKILGDDRLNMLPILKRLSEFLVEVAASDTPRMTEMGICKDGNMSEIFIRLWASKGQTPVERIAELRNELDELKGKKP